MLTRELEGFVETREEQRPLVASEVHHFLLHLLRVKPLLGVDALREMDVSLCVIRKRNDYSVYWWQMVSHAVNVYANI